MIRVLAVDPGLVGAAVVYNPAAPFITEFDLVDLPRVGQGSQARIDVRAFAQWILQHKKIAPIDHAYIEAVGIHPTWGRVPSFRFGRAVGAIETAVALCGLPVTLIGPRRWQAYFGLKGGDKHLSRAMAIKLVPAAAHLLTRALDNNRGEALLIAKYGADQHARLASLRSVKEASHGNPSVRRQHLCDRRCCQQDTSFRRLATRRDRWNSPQH